MTRPTQATGKNCPGFGVHEPSQLSRHSPDISPGILRCVPSPGTRSTVNPAPPVHRSHTRQGTCVSRRNIPACGSPLAAYPQVQCFLLPVDGLPVHPVAGPLQDAGEFVVSGQRLNYWLNYSVTRRAACRSLYQTYSASREQQTSRRRPLFSGSTHAHTAKPDRAVPREAEAAVSGG
jgi:hypothetical protein